MEKEATRKRPNMIKKSRKSESGSPKIEENGDRGCLEATRERGIGKKCRFCLPVVSLFVDFGGKWEPRWQPKSIKNRCKIDTKKHIFCTQLKPAVRHGIGSQDGRKMDPKTVSGVCGKRSCNKPKEKSKNDTPLSVFGVFPSDAGCKIHEKSKKNGPQK